MLPATPRNTTPHKRRRGLSLVEVLVVCGLMSAISAFTMVIYYTAMGDFEHASVKYSMSIHARRAAGKIESILATASARRPGLVAEAFYSPLPSQTGELTGCDFITASNFIQKNATECSYAFDDGSVITGYTPLFRYRLAWTPTPIAPNVPAKAVYLQRLNDDGTNISSGGGSYLQVLATDIGRCTFRRTTSGNIAVRILIYAFDPDTGKSLDGQRMSTLTRRSRTDATSTATRLDPKSYELLTSVPLPTLTIKK